MNLTLIAQGLRLIADGLDTGANTPAAHVVSAANPAPTPVAPPAPAPSLYAAAPAAPQPTPTPAPAITKQDVIDRFMSVAQTKGQDAVIAILRAHGLNRISEANEAQLAQLYAAAGA